MKKGTFYAVGVGPGDPELITVKAARILREADVIAVPDKGSGEKTALQIAASYVQGKPVLACPTPMVRDREVLDRGYDAIADRLGTELEQGRTVAMLTLGDPTVYSTAFYIHERLRRRGYESRLIAGVPSFCACAAALGESLCERSQRMTVIPGGADFSDVLAFPGTRIFMTSGKAILQLQEQLRAAGLLERAMAVENCGMPGQRIWEHFADMEQPCGYFCVVIVKA